MKNLTKLFGIIAIVAIIGFSMTACDNGGGGDTDLPPEQLSTSERWSSWADPKSTATITHSVADDGVCTIVVGGTAEANSWDDWKANAAYSYTAKKDTGYSYTFEAWTASGTRDINVQYYWDDADSLGLQDCITLTTTEKSFTVTGDAIPKAGVRALSFRGANQIGTFYVKIISITEANTDPKTLRITMPSTIFSQANSGFQVGVFPAGTTTQQAFNMTGLIAGCDDETPGVDYTQSGSNYIVTLPLYDMSTNNRWTGSGTFDIYAALGSSNFYKAGSVNISSATTSITINASNAVQQ